jgi:hypothetical protein
MGNAWMDHERPRSAENKHLEVIPPVKTQVLSPERAMLPLDAANPASPGMGAGN